MYPEITGRLRRIDQVLNEEFHIDQRVERVLKDLRDGMEFLANRVLALEKAAEQDPGEG